MQAKNYSLNLISEVLKTIEKVGIEPTMQAVKDLRKISPPEKQVIEIIFSCCCGYYRINKNTIMEGHDRGSSKRKEATTICFMLFEDHLRFSQEQISDYFNKHKSVISRYMKWFRALDKKIKQEAELLYDYEQIMTSVKQQILKINGRAETGSRKAA